MWLFTKYGFYSASVRDVDGGMINVRARVRQHLVNLKRRFGGIYPSLKRAKIIVLPRADYEFRIEIPKATWIAVCGDLASEQTWGNFKNEAEKAFQGDPAGSEYVHSLHLVWSVMYRLQCKPAIPADEFAWMSKAAAYEAPAENEGEIND